jgi:hypothetical protein
LLVGAGCSSDEIELLVDLRTDHRAGLEFDLVRVALDTPAGERVRAAEEPVTRSQEFLTGRRIAELRGVPLGAHVLALELVGDGTVVARTEIALDIAGTRGVTVTITRDCDGVACSAPGTSCLNGRCLADACSLGETVGCEPACASPSDCPRGAACAQPACSGGVCLLAADDSACAMGLCIPEIGCGGGIVDAGSMDGGDMRDAGSPSDAGRDAGFDPSLVLWLPFDEPDAFADLSGNELDAQCLAPDCPNVVVGHRDDAVSFDGIDDGLVVPSNPLLDTAAGFTVAFWMMAETIDSVQTAAAKPLGTTDANSWELFHNAGRLLGAAVAGEGEFATYATPMSTWLHVALVWNGAEVRLYVDGTMRGSAPKTAVPFDAHGVYLGMDEDDGALVNFFDGLLDDLRIYDRPLTQIEILELMAR